VPQPYVQREVLLHTPSFIPMPQIWPLPQVAPPNGVVASLNASQVTGGAQKGPPDPSTELAEIEREYGRIADDGVDAQAPTAPRL
jgi:hypothetical protein